MSADNEKKPTLAQVAAEAAAIDVIVATLAPLDASQQKRVLDYVRLIVEAWGGPWQTPIPIPGPIEHPHPGPLMPTTVAIYACPPWPGSERYGDSFGIISNVDEPQITVDGKPHPEKP